MAGQSDQLPWLLFKKSQPMPDLGLNPQPDTWLAQWYLCPNPAIHKLEINQKFWTELKQIEINVIYLNKAVDLYYVTKQHQIWTHGRRSRLKSTSATSRPQSLFFGYNYLEANFYSIASRRGKKTTSAMARWHWLVRRPWTFITVFTSRHLGPSILVPSFGSRDGGSQHLGPEHS